MVGVMTLTGSVVVDHMHHAAHTCSRSSGRT